MKRFESDPAPRTRSIVTGTVLLSLLLPACTSTATAPGLQPFSPDAEISVLFVGNSLTYTNDLPSLVRTVAEAAGHTMDAASLAFPDFSLEDHWNSGAADAIRALRPDVVVMQQGPSSLPQNQIYLREWTQTLNVVIRDVGAEPALFMVWPSRDRFDFFADVRTSYLDAATAVGGTFIPAGQAWIEAWEVDPDLALYGPDGFHPSRLGSEVAALTIFRVLFDESVANLPQTLSPTTPGLPVIDLGASAALVLGAVETAVEGWALSR